MQLLGTQEITRADIYIYAGAQLGSCLSYRCLPAFSGVYQPRQLKKTQRAKDGKVNKGRLDSCRRRRRSQWPSLPLPSLRRSARECGIQINNNRRLTARSASLARLHLPSRFPEHGGIFSKKPRRAVEEAKGRFAERRQLRRPACASGPKRRQSEEAPPESSARFNAKTWGKTQDT